MKSKKRDLFDASSGPFGLQWDSPGDSLRVMTSKQVKPSNKVAAFDMDGTWVTPKDPKAKFASSRTDWRWWNDAVPGELKRLAGEGYHIVILSNQAGVSKGHTTDEAVMGKLFDLAEIIGVPFSALLACAEDKYRKPGVAMWEHFVQHCNKGIKPTNAFYCGDAAGRSAAWDGKKTTKKDFSCSDRKFAANIGVPFVTPEETFLKQEPTKSWAWGSPHPRELLATYLTAPKRALAMSVLAAPAATPEVVIMVGMPASGKSSLSRQLAALHGHVRVCNDEMGSKAKCKKVASDALAKGQSVVVDNTNPSVDVRSEWIAMAQKCGAKSFRCIVMDTPFDVAHHLNLFREAHGGAKRVPDVAMHSFRKHYVLPTKGEGFSRVDVVPFQIDGSLDGVQELATHWL